MHYSWWLESSLNFATLAVAFTIYEWALLVEERIRKSYRGVTLFFQLFRLDFGIILEFGL
jgi:hypothetical protein